MTLLAGTHLHVKFSRVVDGDTIRVFLPGQDKDESLRILALDTEESRAGGGKPVTPWGKKAKDRAIEFFQGSDEVTIEFPGNEDVETCIGKYRGNYGRLLVFVYRDGIDFQQTMIHEGYSPYFVKYGNAVFSSHHQRYQKAEMEAQRRKIGVWDQLTVNGSEQRNYSLLGTWWKLRAAIIDEYRKIKAKDSSIFNTRLDYATLKEKAQAGEKATVFTELRSIERVGGCSGLVFIGSNQQPFNLYIPDIDSPEGQEIVNLLETRYMSSGEDYPKRSYGYVTGELSTFHDKPQIVLFSADQITDDVPNTREDTVSPTVRIVSILPNPVGSDSGKERVTLRNTGTEPVNLRGWFLQDFANHRIALTDVLEPGEDKDILLREGPMLLNNSGDELFLIDSKGKVCCQVTYSANDVEAGQPIRFLYR